MKKYFSSKFLGYFKGSCAAKMGFQNDIFKLAVNWLMIFQSLFDWSERHLDNINLKALLRGVLQGDTIDLSTVS